MAPTISLATFATEFLSVYAEVQNKPSETESKRRILALHLVPALGHLPLDRIGRREIAGFQAAQLAAGLSAKTVNNQVSILHTLLTVACEWEIIPSVPHVRWLKTSDPGFDFLTFAEADRLVAAADPEWRAMLYKYSSDDGGYLQRHEMMDQQMIHMRAARGMFDTIYKDGDILAGGNPAAVEGEENQWSITGTIIYL